MYQAAQQLNTVAAYEAVIAAAPGSPYAQLARAAIDKRRAGGAAGPPSVSGESASRRQRLAPRRDPVSCATASAWSSCGSSRGRFRWGRRSGEAERDDDEGPVHKVTISQPFYLGKYEVTQGQWQAVMGDNPSHFSDCGATCPVENVSWDDVQGFIEELNLREGVRVYRLPTETEWEYAARAGTQTVYSFGNAVNRSGQYGWYGENSDGRPHPVGQKQPNGFGLYDIHGNVWEWVQDCWNASYAGAPRDGRAWESGECGRRVLRGGSWDSADRGSSVRLTATGTPLTIGSINGGFRIARSLP